MANRGLLGSFVALAIAMVFADWSQPKALPARWQR